MPLDRKGCLRALDFVLVFVWGLIFGTMGTCMVLPRPLEKGTPDRLDMRAFLDQGLKVAVPIGALLGLLIALVYLLWSARRPRR